MDETLESLIKSVEECNAGLIEYSAEIEKDGKKYLFKYSLELIQEE